jgi:hypothetical protein
VSDSNDIPNAASLPCALDAIQFSNIPIEYLLYLQAALEKFDLIFITEWMSDSKQLAPLSSVFPTEKRSAKLEQKVKGDDDSKTRLKKKLAKDEVGNFVLSPLSA